VPIILGVRDTRQVYFASLDSVIIQATQVPQVPNAEAESPGLTRAS